MEITENQAIAISRKFFNIEESIPASIWRVKNLYKLSNDYFIVIFGEQNASIAVATVGCEKGDVRISARLPGKLPQLNIDKKKAIELTNSNPNVQIEMVWMPGKLSRSQLYPIWKVYTINGVRYVNQYGNVDKEM